MINKKIIIGIIGIIIFFIVLVIIIYNSNKKKEKFYIPKLSNNENVIKSLQKQSNSNNTNISKLYDDLIKSLEKKNKHKINEATHYSSEYQRTKYITNQLLEYHTKQLKKKLWDPPANPTVQKQISDNSGDLGSSPAIKAGLSAGKEQITSLLNALYSEFTDSSNPQSMTNLLDSVGVTILNVALACAGLGFLTKFLDGIISQKPIKTPTGPQLVSSLESWIANYVPSQTAQTAISAVQDNLQLVAAYANYYEGIKSGSMYALCPQPAPCDLNSDTPPACDLQKANNNIINCMKNPSNFNVPPLPQYDPSIIYTSNKSINSKRSYLNSTILAAAPGGAGGSSCLFMLTMNGIQNIINIIKDLPQSTNNNPAFARTFATLYPSYNFTITNIISYFQELALIDTSNNNGVIVNPWMSSSIGSPGVLLNTPPSNQMQNSTCLLGELQKYASYPKNGIVNFSPSSLSIDYYSFIVNIFYWYFLNLSFSEKDNGCCPRGCGYTTRCYQWTYISDNNGILNNTWYSLICQKYDDYGNLSNGAPVPSNTSVPLYGGPNTYAFFSHDSTAWQAIVTKYLTYFNEYLNFPFDNYILILKAAGVLLQKSDGTNATSSDLFNNMLWSLYTTNGTNTTSNSVFTINTPVNYITLKPINDTSAGYPFGLDKPSFLEAYNMTKTPSNKLDDIDKYNTYCTPIVSISEGNSFDASIFNISGDPNTYGSNMYCLDKNADSVLSCLVPGMSPGNVNNQATDKSRLAYCKDSRTGFTSPILQGNSTLPQNGYLKCWDLHFGGGVLDMLITLPSGQSALFSGSITTWTVNGNTVTIVGGNKGNNNPYSGTITFDSNQSIIGGSGDYSTIVQNNYYNPILPYFGIDISTPAGNILVAPKSGYKYWDLLGDGTNILSIDSSGNWDLNGSVVTNNAGWFTYFIVDSTTSFIFGESEYIIGGSINNTTLTKLPVQYYLVTFPLTPQIPMKKYWSLQAGNINYLLILDSTGNWTITFSTIINMGNNFPNTEVSYVGYKTSLVTTGLVSTFKFYGIAKIISMEIDLTVTFGTKENIISGSLTNKYFSTTVNISPLPVIPQLHG